MAKKVVLAYSGGLDTSVAVRWMADKWGVDVVAAAVKANALYEGRYPLVSSLSRPIIVEHLVEAARRYGADGVAHGCTGKGNDQVRFEVSTRALAPDLEVLAPVRT